MSANAAYRRRRRRTSSTGGDLASLLWFVLLSIFLVYWLLVTAMVLFLLEVWGICWDIGTLISTWQVLRSRRRGETSALTLGRPSWLPPWRSALAPVRHANRLLAQVSDANPA